MEYFVRLFDNHSASSVSIVESIVLSGNQATYAVSVKTWRNMDPSTATSPLLKAQTR